MILISLFVPTICYVITGISFFMKKDYPHGLIFLSYAVANSGFIWYEIRRGS
jgi:hypothetical protein